MGGDDELHISPVMNCRNIRNSSSCILWREGILRLVQKVQSFPAKAVLKKCHVGLAMGLEHEGAVAKIVQAPGIGHAPCIKDLGKMPENFRGKE